MGGYRSLQDFHKKYWCRNAKLMGNYGKQHTERDRHGERQMERVCYFDNGIHLLNSGLWPRVQVTAQSRQIRRQTVGACHDLVRALPLVVA